MAAAGRDARVERVRQFNRFYTARIGVLQRHLLQSPFSLTEARVLYELAHRDHPAAAALAKDLGLDPGYLSRLLAGFVRHGLVRRRASETDRRRAGLALTAKGQRTFSALERRSRDDVRAMLDALPPGGDRQVLDAMETIETALGGGTPRARSLILRTHQPGDMGWVVSIHGSFYAEQFGWDITFEALVAGIVRHFIEHFDPSAERCWIAELDGERVGSVFVVRKSKTVAKLRLLIVDPRAHGLGVGSRLVDECTRFARQAGYRKLTLWTNSILDAARHVYEKAGYRLVQTAPPERRFGKELVFETWELTL